MADGTFTTSFEMALTAAVLAAMEGRLQFAVLRRTVAALGKAYGVFVYGTDRVDGKIVIVFEGGSIAVIETDAYRRFVPLSTW